MHRNIEDIRLLIIISVGKHNKNRDCNEHPNETAKLPSPYNTVAHNALLCRTLPKPTAFDETLSVTFHNPIKTNGQLFRQLLVVNPANVKEVETPGERRIEPPPWVQRRSMERDDDLVVCQDMRQESKSTVWESVALYLFGGSVAFLRVDLFGDPI
ncbi:hypothetical protein BDZ45DRAFT_734663 [Acephala macrosclerotiorum]|nr:hypothetical protein BDZ45DRAFT_734663 [Acephala macrosclerotiorum]